MDPGTAALMVGGTRLFFDIWKEWRDGRKQKKGIVAGPTGEFVPVPITDHGFSVEHMDFLFDEDFDTHPIKIQGAFVSDLDFIEFAEILLDDEDKRIVMMVKDEVTSNVYFFEFEFDGFELDLWPGTYSFYVFIIDPFDDEVLGIGYPDFGTDEDPNPIQLSGEGYLDGDFIIFDADEFL